MTGVQTCALPISARFLAATYGCRVVGVDLMPEYCAAARELARWVKLDRLVEFQAGDALALPCADRAFDVAWTQHVAMNIADKSRLYAEIARVLAPGGRLALYDVVQGPGGAVVYPMPWAADESISFLVPPGELRYLLANAGFAIEHWHDATAAARAWLDEIERERAASKTPPPPHPLLGADAAAIRANLRRNLDEHRIALVEAVCRRG